MANRSILHTNQLKAFIEWLKKDGWEILPASKNPYEVLRAKKDGKQYPLIVYRKGDAKEHLSVTDRDMPVVGAFLRDMKKARTNADRIRAMNDKELAIFLINFKNIFRGEYEGEESCLDWLQSEAKDKMNRIKPILFNTDMVCAVLDNRKTVTRRTVKPTQIIGLGCDRCPNNLPEEYIKEKKKKMLFKPWCDMADNELIGSIYKTPYEPGDILYVRETYSPNYFDESLADYRGDGLRGNRHAYKADYRRDIVGDSVPEPKWKPCIHMPKEAACIWLKVTAVRAERLQDITGADAVKEGEIPVIHMNGEPDEAATRTAFISTWNDTVTDADMEQYGWDANPYVWVIEFERCEKPDGCDG